ncbi:unnamed protein product, partial [Choristocarpus tenellus]
IGNHQNFKVVKPSLEILVESLGGYCLMVPKYRCELNPIEMVWGRTKQYVRGHCDYTLPGMRANIPVSVSRMKGGCPE